MMLWPPIFTTLTQGRMAKWGVRSVAACRAGSLSDPPARRRPSSVSMSFEVVSCMDRIPCREGEDLQLEAVRLADGRVEAAEGRNRPVGEGGKRRLGGCRGQHRKPRPGALAMEIAPGRPLRAPGRDCDGAPRGDAGKPSLDVLAHVAPPDRDA